MPRGIWLDEAISIHQARLSLHDLFSNLYYGDRHPPLHHLALWLTIRAFGDGEFAVRLPSLIAGTLVIPALYELGRELYDRRTGLIAAAFAAVSPLLVWYSQEVRMYAFVTLFGLLALLTQLRAIRNATMVNWAAYILATAALLWSHYFGLLLIGVQQLIFVGVLIHRRRSGEPVRPLALGFAYSAAVLVMQLVPLAVFAHHQFQSTGAAAGSPSGTYDPLSFYAVVSNMAWALWGYQPDATTALLAAMWPLLLLLSLLLLGRGGSRQTLILAAAAHRPRRAAADRVRVRPRAVRGALLPARRAAAAAARRAARHRLDPQTEGTAARRRRRRADAAARPGQPADEQGQPPAVRLPRRDREDQGGRRTEEPRAVRADRHALRARVLRARPPAAGRSASACPSAGRGAPSSSSPRSRTTSAFFNETNKVVGQLTFFRRLVRRFKTAQTLVWEFR